MSLWVLIALVLFVAAGAMALRTNAWRSTLATVAARPMGNGSEVPITVLVPVRNGVDELAALLQDLHAQDHSRDLTEVLVVDDHSEEPVQRVVQNMARHWPQLRYLRLEEGEGKKAAIMAGVANAQHELILLTDADARCGMGRVSAVAAAMLARPCDLLLLPVRTQGEGVCGTLQVEEQAALLAALVGSWSEGRPVLANGANLAFTRAAFAAVGGYRGDTRSSGDDVFLLQRMRRARRTVEVALDPALWVQVQAAPNCGAALAQRLRWAGKMGAVRDPLATLWTLVSMVLPWALAVFTAVALKEQRIGDGLLRTWLLVLAAWGAWCIPLVQATGDVHRLVGEIPVRPWRTFLALIAFTVYAPVIAVVSRVVRPQWKGRKVR
jgi:cellulose synthase/poly-beta-1,6-N-acetylglucosamine synthase-like glycosyltransferase